MKHKYMLFTYRQYWDDCEANFEPINATSFDSAIELATKWLFEQKRPDLIEATVFEVTNKKEIDLKQLETKWKMVREEAKRAAKEAAKRELYEKLKKEFEE